jgi:hypothetical protein
MEALRELFHEWERWSAELLKGHLSYPVLVYFRSEHDDQSWLATLTAILDTCALVMAGLEGACDRQAELTFAMARHAVVDLSLVFRRGPKEPEPERLSPEKLAEPRALLAGSGLKLPEGEAIDRRLAELRQLYEPYVYSLATYFRARIPHGPPRENGWTTGK